ncbi:hypothetical protein [Pseudoalteromonas sp. Of7M-16]|uniref:hypothetical protein n=1 Tax=Pseudoalteromonas sp. Of7M-16 TaxID=2917756 RepID=UPI001EF66D48|nr:hypothetical protein [Pseudoalteromonas sp. Of7M-16]MCG7546956.1 hypothetical protein [Pseudoalteromonas sp. Of7M-16]
MGGKSRSSQNTSTNQTSYSQVNDGQFAGASNVDASRTDIDYEVDNSVRNDIDNSVRNDYDYDYEYDYELNQDIDNSVRNDIDNSVRNDYELNQDIDNSVRNDIDNSIENDGEYAGNSGVINILDGGAIDASREISLHAIESSEHALSQMNDVTNNALNFGEHAIDEVGDIARYLSNEYVGGLATANAVNASEMADVSNHSVDAMESLSKAIALGNHAMVSDISGDLRDIHADNTGLLNSLSETLSDNQFNSLSAVSLLSNNVLGNQNEMLTAVTENLGNSHVQNLAKLSDVQTDVTEFLANATESNITANDAALERVAALAKSTSLQGQDLVAKSASDMVRYISIAVGVGVAVVMVAMIATKGSGK